MSLKDCIARDIDAVFLNTNDFCRYELWRFSWIALLQSTC